MVLQEMGCPPVGLADSVPAVIDLDEVQWHLLLRMACHQHGRAKLATLLKVVPSLIEDNWLARRATVVVLANAREARFLRTSRPVVAVPNGFAFPAQLQITPRESKRVLFLGALYYYPNRDGLLWFCRNIWPRVREAVPDAVLDVVGHYDRDLGTLASLPGVILHGFVPVVDPFIAQSACLVVPLRIAGGTRLKVLEAWAKGLPVVSTSIGIEGLQTEERQTALICDRADVFAETVVNLLAAPELRLRLATDGFEYGKEQFSWEAIYRCIGEAVELGLMTEHHK